jgi:hypothetical protein
MPHDLYRWIERIKSIERDHTATRLALNRLLEGARRDPAILGGDLKLQDLVNASGRLEGRVAPGDCSPGAPTDPYGHFRAYGSSGHVLATGRHTE